MPVYTYRCENCGVQFDRHQSFSDPPLSQCPECKKKALRKVYTPVGIVFKGSGFYATDHRSPSGTGRTPGGEKSEGGEKESTSSDDTSSESPSGEGARTTENEKQQKKVEKLD
jgi:putative FmdB family regulatory protein